MKRSIIRNAGLSLALAAGLGLGAGMALADYADGTYEAEGKGIGGKVPVTVVIEDGAIASVEVGDNSETQGIGSKAIEQLPALIVEANGLEGVDGVSGASVTSKAIFTAVEEALAAAEAGEGDEAEAAVATQWAFPFVMDSEELGLGTIYYTAAYFAAADETTINPLDPEYAPYTAEALADLIAAADTYEVQDAPAAAVLGMSAYGSDRIFWYDEAGAAAITSSAAPLALDAATGEVAVGDEVVAPIAE